MAKRKPAPATVGKRVALYVRVSTTGQTTTNQRRELEAVAARHGWEVVQVFSDDGISGAKGRKDRPGLDAFIIRATRRCWSSRRKRPAGATRCPKAKAAASRSPKHLAAMSRRSPK
jgi:Resolvase, N terminal domain